LNSFPSPNYKYFAPLGLALGSQIIPERNPFTPQDNQETNPV
jgi:hypothetical protein